MTPQVGHHVLTTRPPGPLRPPGPPRDHLARCWPCPSLITTLISSLPLMTALSRVWRLRITDEQQLGPPAAHQHPKGLKGVMMLCLCLRGEVAAQCAHSHHAGIIFAGKQWCSNHSLCLAKPKPLLVHNTLICDWKYRWTLLPFVVSWFISPAYGLLKSMSFDGRQPAWHKSPGSARVCFPVSSDGPEEWSRCDERESPSVLLISLGCDGGDTCLRGLLGLWFFSEVSCMLHSSILLWPGWMTTYNLLLPCVWIRYLDSGCWIFI